MCGDVCTMRQPFSVCVRVQHNTSLIHLYNETAILGYVSKVNTLYTKQGNIPQYACMYNTKLRLHKMGGVFIQYIPRHHILTITCPHNEHQENLHFTLLCFFMLFHAFGAF